MQTTEQTETRESGSLQRPGSATYDTEHRDNIVCPHCGYQDRDSREVDCGPGLEGETEHECADCGQTMKAERCCTVTYTTTKSAERPSSATAGPRAWIARKMFKLSVIFNRRVGRRFAAAPWLGTQQGVITNIKLRVSVNSTERNGRSCYDLRIQASDSVKPSDVPTRSSRNPERTESLPAPNANSKSKRSRCGLTTELTDSR